MSDGYGHRTTFGSETLVVFGAIMKSGLQLFFSIFLLHFSRNFSEHTSASTSEAAVRSNVISLCASDVLPAQW